MTQLPSLVTRGFQAYALALVALAVTTYVYVTTGIDIAHTALGASWLALAGGGILLIGGLVLTRHDSLQVPTQQRDDFMDDAMTSMPLSIYMGGLLGWSVVTVAWYTTLLAPISHVVIAAGWFAIAAFGTVLVFALWQTQLAADTSLQFALRR